MDILTPVMIGLWVLVLTRLTWGVLEEPAQKLRLWTIYKFERWQERRKGKG